MNYLPAFNRYDKMIYKRCGGSGIKLPLISLGLWHNFGGVDVFENARSMIHTAFDLGITHFDLANNYGPPPGSAEENFGKILKQDLSGYRDELVISTKAGWNMWPGPYGDFGSRKYLIASLDQSLKRYLLHNLRWLVLGKMPIQSNFHLWSYELQKINLSRQRMQRKIRKIMKRKD